MKKLRFFKSLFLFLLGITTAAAQEKVEPNKFETTTIEGGQFKNPKWYLVSMNQDIPGYGHAKGYMKANDTDASIDLFSQSNQINSEDAKQLWCFVAVEGGYQIYNKEKGTSKCVTYSAEGGPHNNGLAIFKEPAADNKSTWILTETSVQNYKNQGGFCFKTNGASGNLQYLNKQDGKLSFWSEADQGSTFFVQSVDLEVVNNKLNTAITKADKYNGLIGSGVGKYTDNNNAFTTALQNAKNAQSSETSVSSKLDCTNKLEKAITSLRLNMPETGKFYRFQGKTSGRYASSKSTVAINNYPDAIELIQETGTNGETVFYYTGDKHLIGNNILYADGNQNNQDGAGSTFTISAHGSEVGCYLVKPSDINYWCDWDSKSKYYIDRHTNTSLNRTAWKITEITEIADQPKLTKEMSANFATLAAPVALTIPEGVKAYTVEANEGKAVLTEVNTTIPAGTAVLLEKTGSESNFSFNFAASADAVESTNHLHGVYKAKDIPEGSYILANGNSGIGFYKVKASERNLAANKAYLTVPAAQANLQSIIIGGNTTGIDEIVTEEAAKEIYFDLQGRRVQNPTKGIYVTKSGKKVIFN